MNMNKFTNIIVILLSLTLFSCAANNGEYIIKKSSTAVLPRPQAITLERVKFDSTVIDGKSYFVLSVSDYQNLSININKIMKYSKDSNTIIKAYEDMIKKSNGE